MTLLTFVDNAHVEVVQNLTRVQARLDNAGAPVLGRDREWESTLYMSGTWSLRRVEDTFRLWYENWDFNVALANSASAAFAETGGSQRFSSLALSRMQVMLAESTDGTTWRKPDLGSGTNVVLGGDGFGNVHAFSTVPDPQGGYRALFVHETEETAKLPHSLIRSARSHDGVDWVVDEESPQFGELGPHLGDVMNLSYDSARREFIVFTRHPEQFVTPPEPLRSPHTAGSFFAPFRPGDAEYFNKRRIWLSRSADFARWTQPEEVLLPGGDLDNIDDSFYSLAHLDTGDGHLGFLSVLHEVDDTMDVWLVSSRDLVTWERVPGAGPLIARGGPGTWNEGIVNVCSPPVALDDDLFVFYVGAPHRHDWWWVGRREGLDVPDARLDRGEYQLGLSRIGRNRLVGLRAGERVGMLVTPPLQEGGGRLTIDAEIEPGGHVQVEIVGADGASTAWDGSVAARAGDRLRVIARRATVYSLHLGGSEEKKDT